IRVYEQEVIVVPVFLLASFLITLVFILLLRFCPEKVDRIRPKSKVTTRRILHGIDPSGINVLEHESIALDMPNSYSTFRSPHTYLNKAFSNSVETLPQHPSPPPQETFKPTFTLPPQPRELPRQRLPESFNLVTPLSGTFSLRTDSSVSIYRARMENRNVVLRVLNSANATERHNFLGFASFLAQLGPHPFLPELLGVVSLRAPLVTVVEELENRDLLSFLWRCREAFLHSKDLLHGNIRARSVLISKMFTAKLWGLHGVYTRKNQGATQREDPSMKKWQAPEVLAKRPASEKSDWSFGILLYEMEAPFAEIPANELLQFHQRGKNLKKPSNCSNAYTIIKGCCQWKDQERPTLAEVSKKLASGEKAASDKVIKASGTVDIEQYLKEAGYGEANSYTVF
uniref:Serine/threonine/tyrosine kinase 1b n=1 Tax=Neolamprologus brichardi TaxID=32507 RepID=A0A3Q4G107_NEOBR